MSPAMLFIDTVWYEVLQITLTALIGMTGIAAGLSGFLVKNMNAIERLVAIAGGLLLIIPGTVTDLIGVALVVLVVVVQILAKKKAKA